MTETKIIKIFLASSFELKDDREQFEIFINRNNKEYIRKGIFLELVIWEDFLDAMSATRLQDEYNQAITNCDVFVSLFWKKVGQYTEEEFEKAFASFKKNKKPLIYTFFKEESILPSQAKQMQTVFNFQSKLRKLGHFHTNYADINDLKYKFSKQLDKFIPKLNSAQQEKLFSSIDNLLDTNISNIDPNFDNSWSSLCLLLKDIDGPNIWNACNKIFDTSRKFDWRDKTLLKRICLTKSFDCLKQFFIEENDSQIIISFAQELDKQIKNANKDLTSFLNEPEHEIDNESNIVKKEEQEDFEPILLVIVDKLANGEDNWIVYAQLKFQGFQETIVLRKDGIPGVKCRNFEEIPSQIEAYIIHLNGEPKLNKISTEDLPIEDLRIEVFLPIANMNLNFDCWSEVLEENSSIYLVKNNRLFLRSRERYKGNRGRTYKNMLKKGWDKLELFLDEDQSINRSVLTEKIEDLQQNSHELLIQKNDQVDNWTKLKNFMVKCSKLWGVRLQDTLPDNIIERGEFLTAIYLSGIPVFCWYWEYIPDDLKQSIEDELINCFCCESLSERCHNLLEQTWLLRSNAWGETDEAKRKESPGYYFGMLLEDPKIMPIDADLKAAGGQK